MVNVLTSVDSVLKGFVKTIDKLQKLSDAKEWHVTTNALTIDNLQKNNKVLSEDAARARRIAAKIQEILDA